MSSRTHRTRIEVTWIVLIIACAFLLGLASVLKYRHAAILTLHFDQFEYSSSKPAVNTPHATKQPTEPPMDDLAQRSRTQFAAFLGLKNLSNQSVELESEKWKPIILRNCAEDMLPFYAPCLTKVFPNLEYGEEVVYPDFEAAMPGFFDMQDAETWLDSNYGYDKQGQTGSNKRVIVDKRQGRLVFTGLRGQNLAFKNVRYHDLALPSSWVGDSSHCLGHMTSTETFHLQQQQQQQQQQRQKPHANGTSGDEDKDDVVEEAAVYATPDSERYQHFLDHTTKPLMQSAHLISGKTLILPGSAIEFKQPIVQMMWRWLPHINKSQLHGGDRDLFVRRLLVSCRVPYVHPYLFFRLQEMVLGPEAPRVPLSERKVVVWYSRSRLDANRQNHGREITNEQEVLNAIRKLLEERGRGERLEIHPPASEGTMDPLEYIKYLNRNAAALMGPHGGGLCNFKWLAINTLVLELMPQDWISTPLYEDAIGHGLNYWVDLLPSRGYRHNMMANISRIVGLLRAELGKEPARGPIIRYRYDWPAALEDGVGQDQRRSTYFTSLKGKCCNNAAGSEGLHVLRIPG